MREIGITTLQNRPALLKEIALSAIVDKRAHKKVGYFISTKYESLLQDLLEEIERQERREKLERLKHYQDMEFLETGIDDGLA
jgi:hypothetical protein